MLVRRQGLNYNWLIKEKRFTHIFGKMRNLWTFLAIVAFIFTPSHVHAEHIGGFISNVYYKFMKTTLACNNQFSKVVNIVDCLVKQMLLENSFSYCDGKITDDTQLEIHENIKKFEKLMGTNISDETTNERFELLVLRYRCSENVKVINTLTIISMICELFVLSFYIFFRKMTYSYFGKCVICYIIYLILFQGYSMVKTQTAVDIFLMVIFHIFSYFWMNLLTYEVFVSTKRQVNHILIVINLKMTKAFFQSHS